MNKQKIQLMDFVDQAKDEEVLFLLMTGQVPNQDKKLRFQESDGAAYRIDEISNVPTYIDVALGALGGTSLVKGVSAAGKAGTSGYLTYKHVQHPEKEEKPWGYSTRTLAGQALSSLAYAVALKVRKNHMLKWEKKCEKEKGVAKKVCYNKISRDSYRAEIAALNSMKIKCHKAKKNPETCIKNIDKRIKELQKRMNSIKVF